MAETANGNQHSNHRTNSDRLMCEGGDRSYMCDDVLDRCGECHAVNNHHFMCSAHADNATTEATETTETAETRDGNDCDRCNVCKFYLSNPELVHKDLPPCGAQCAHCSTDATREVLRQTRDGNATTETAETGDGCMVNVADNTTRDASWQCGADVIGRIVRPHSPAGGGTPVCTDHVSGWGANETFVPNVAETAETTETAPIDTAEEFADKYAQNKDGKSTAADPDSVPMWETAETRDGNTPEPNCTCGAHHPSLATKCTPDHHLDVRDSVATCFACGEYATAPETAPNCPVVDHTDNGRIGCANNHPETTETTEPTDTTALDAAILAHRADPTEANSDAVLVAQKNQYVATIRREILGLGETPDATTDAHTDARNGSSCDAECVSMSSSSHNDLIEDAAPERPRRVVACLSKDAQYPVDGRCPEPATRGDYCSDHAARFQTGDAVEITGAHGPATLTRPDGTTRKITDALYLMGEFGTITGGDRNYSTTELYCHEVTIHGRYGVYVVGVHQACLKTRTDATMRRDILGEYATAPKVINSGSDPWDCATCGENHETDDCN